MAKMAATARAISRSEGENRESAKRALAGLMADARGVPMKIGQFLASRAGNEAFSDLVTGIPARPLEEMLPELERQLGRPASEVFSSIDESVAAASLGQVHHAELLDGTEVAVKIRYPDIEDAVDAELRLAGMLPGVGPVKKWGFDIGGYQSMMKDNMDRELDYRSEAERQKRFRESVKVPGLVVPRVYTEFCAKGVLVQSWESGMPLESAANWPPEARRATAEILMKTLFTSMFVTGEVHCDPHLGNLFVRKSASGAPEIVLLDFGCMTKVEPRERLALLKLILGCQNNDETDPLACFVEMGFSLPKLQAIADILPALSRILFEPFLRDEPFSTKYWNVVSRTSATLGELRWWFRSAGPPGLFLLMRAFSGMVAHLESLQIIVSWSTMLKEAVGDVALREARAFAPAPVPAAVTRTATSFANMANYLKVRVTENGRQTVQVSLPVGQTSELEDLIPDDVLDAIRASKIDLEVIARNACESGLIPQELFVLENGAKRYRVWLE